jgi:hypothetical protein
LICDTPDRIPARIFRALGSTCACCAFWRGFVLCALLFCAPVLILILK